MLQNFFYKPPNGFGFCLTVQEYLDINLHFFNTLPHGSCTCKFNRQTSKIHHDVRKFLHILKFVISIIITAWSTIKWLVIPFKYFPSSRVVNLFIILRMNNAHNFHGSLVSVRSASTVVSCAMLTVGKRDRKIWEKKKRRLCARER